MKILVVDLETSGLDTRTCDILEIAVASLDLETDLIETELYTLVRPEADGDWRESWFVKNSGVALEMFDAAPVFATIKPKIDDLLKALPATSYNCKFDFDILKRHGVNRIPWPCLMETATPVLKLPGKYNDYKFPKLTEAYEYFCNGLKMSDAHRAQADAVSGACIAKQMHKLGLFQNAVKKAETTGK